MAGNVAWSTKPLEELIEPGSTITYGVVKPGDADPSGVLFIRGGDIADGRVLRSQLRTITPEVSAQYRRTLLRGGELIVSLVGNPGQVALVPPELAGANIARQVGLVRLGSEVDPLFVRYFLFSNEGQAALGAKSLGSVQQVINLSDLKRVHVAVPPLPEQRAIAAVLGALDDKIEVNRKTARVLEGIARAVFTSWFVDFDPVRYNMQCKADEQAYKSMGRAARFGSFGEDVTVIGADGRSRPGRSIDNHRPLAHLFPDRLVDSPIGEVPEGWRVAKLKQLTSKIGSGATPRGGSAVYVDSGVALIRSQNIHDYEFRWDGLARLSEQSAEELRGVDVKANDVLLNITGDSILRTCIVDPTVLPARVNQHVAIIRAIDGVPPRYVHLFMVQPRMKDFLSGLNAGATRPAITKGHLDETDILRPSAEVLAAFDATTSPLFARVQVAVVQNRTLAALRDALLPKLISGELRIADAEKIVGRAV